MDDPDVYGRLVDVRGVTESYGQRRSWSIGARPLQGGESRPDTYADADVEQRLAFGRLVDLHIDRNDRLAAVILGDPTGAQDAVHDAFVTAWRKWDTLRDPGRRGLVYPGDIPPTVVLGMEGSLPGSPAPPAD